MNLRRTLAKILAPVVVSCVALGAGALAAAPAQAVAFSAALSAPVPVEGGGLLSSWADLGRDCTGTFGCANFMTVERAVDGGWQPIGGSWAVLAGWNNLLTPTPLGCFTYRTTVSSYNDVAGPFPGVNLGLVGAAPNGMPVYRYLNTSFSPPIAFCR